MCRILIKGFRKDLSEKMMFEQRPEQNEEASWVKTWATPFQRKGRGNSWPQCKHKPGVFKAQPGGQRR